MSKVYSLRSQRGLITKRKELFDLAAGDSVFTDIVMKYSTIENQHLHAVVWTMSKGQVRKALKEIKDLNFILNEFQA